MELGKLAACAREPRTVVLCHSTVLSEVRELCRSADFNFCFRTFRHPPPAPFKAKTVYPTPRVVII